MKRGDCLLYCLGGCILFTLPEEFVIKLAKGSVKVINSQYTQICDYLTTFWISVFITFIEGVQVVAVYNSRGGCFEVSI